MSNENAKKPIGYEFIKTIREFGNSTIQPLAKNIGIKIVEVNRLADELSAKVDLLIAKQKESEQANDEKAEVGFDIPIPDIADNVSIENEIVEAYNEPLVDVQIEKIDVSLVEKKPKAKSPKTDAVDSVAKSEVKTEEKSESNVDVAPVLDEKVEKVVEAPVEIKEKVEEKSEQVADVKAPEQTKKVVEKKPEAKPVGVQRERRCFDPVTRTVITLKPGEEPPKFQQHGALIRPSGDNRWQNNRQGGQRPDNNGAGARRQEYNADRQKRPFDNRTPNARPPFNKDAATNGSLFKKDKPLIGKKTNSFGDFVSPALSSKEINKNNFKKKNDSKQFDDRLTPKKSVRVKGSNYDINEFEYESEMARHVKVKRGKKNDNFTPVTAKIESAVITTENVPIKTLSEKIGKTATEIISKLFMLDIVKTINESIDFDTASLVASEFGVTLELKLDKSLEERLEDYVITDEVDNGELVPRSPIVTIMGHVDHGKTSLLDYIRKSRVAQGEAGGITQHIGAYTISINNQMITFLDTPGHEAFTAMRARGAQVTDIAIIVVAADDGIMPQSIEAINHAKSAGVATIIAINKMDKPGANPDKVKQQLTEQGIVPEEWGGDAICVNVSAKTGENVDKLLESILLVAELLDLKANRDCAARGVVIESKLDKSKGPVATVLVQNGTLRVADFVVAGFATGKIRAMIDDKGRNVKEVGPSMPVSIIGFSDVPNAGDNMVVVKDEKFAKQIAEERKNKEKSSLNATASANTLDDIFSKISDGTIKDLNLIIKADVQGSFEALKHEMAKIENAEVKVNVIHGGVGAITESDVMLASTSKAIIIGFNVRPDTKAKTLAERDKIDVRTYRIIYDVINDVNMALKGMLAPKLEENVIGHATVREIFKVSGVGTIAGSYVTDGKVSRNAKVRLLRDNVIIFEGEINTLRRFKDDVKEVASGYECGITLNGFNDVKPEDVMECYLVEEVKAD